MTKLTLSHSFSHRGKHTSIECTAETLTIDLDPSKLTAPVATAAAARIAEQFRAAGWFKTGTLVSGITVQSNGNGEYSVVAPPGRLGRPELVERAKEAAPAIDNPLAEASVQKAQEQAVAGMVTKGPMR